MSNAEQAGDTEQRELAEKILKVQQKERKQNKNKERRT